MNDIHIPFGLCEVKYGDTELKYFADAAEFNAIPSFEKLRAGLFETRYLLSDYDVSLSLVLQEETYENMKLSFPGLQTDDNGGMYDDPSKFNRNGLPLIIHPVESGDSKEFDLIIFSAIPDPENPYKRVYGKEKDVINVKFKGQPAKRFNTKGFKSFFYIGDWETAGVLNG